MTEITTATLDGADTFIVSHETSTGANNISSVINLAKAIAEAENIFDYEQAYVNMRDDTQKEGRLATDLDILMTSSCGIAFEKDADVDMFVCVTDTGKLPSYLSKQRPRQPILACSTSGQVVRQANMVRGVVGYKIPEHMAAKEEELLDLLLKVAQEQGLCNLPYSKVMIFIGENEGDAKKEKITFKVIGGEELPEEDPE